MLPRWRLGALLGFPIYVNVTFLALLAIAFMWLGGIAGVIAVGVVFASVLLHELGHAVVARRRRVAIGGIELSFLGGAAQMDQLPRSATDEIAIALAGPAVSVALAGLGLGLGAVTGVEAITTVGWINLVLAAFNLLPALPMDGGRVLRALLSFGTDYARATEHAVTVARVLAIGLGLLGLAGQVQLLVLAPLLWIMGSRERQLARAVGHRFVRTRRGYRERPPVVMAAPWFVVPRWRAM